MDFSIVERPNLLTFVFRGDIRDERTDAIASEIRLVCKGRYSNLLWDFSDVYILQPRFFGFLASFFSRIIISGYKPVVVDPRMQALGALHSLGLDSKVEFVRNEDEAYEVFLEELKFSYNKLFCQLLLQEGLLTPQELQKALLEYNRIKKRLPFGRILVHMGLLTARQIIRAIEKQKCFFGEILVDMKIVSRKQLNETLKVQAKAGGKEKIGELLVRLGFCSNTDIYGAISTQFKRKRMGRK